MTYGTELAFLLLKPRVQLDTARTGITGKQANEIKNQQDQ